MTKLKFFILFCLILGLTSCSNHSSHILQGYVEGYFTYVSSPYGGKLLELPVDRGDLVNENKLLFLLDPQPELDQLKQAEHNLAQAKQTLLDVEKGQRATILEGIIAQRGQASAQLDLSHKTLYRYQMLYKVGAIDKASVDSAFADYQANVKRVKELNANLSEAKLGARKNQIQAQEAVVKAAAAAVKQAKWALQQKTVYAPAAGRIFNTYYCVGEYVEAGQPVVSMLTPDDVRLIFFVPEPYLGKIKLNQHITFYYDGNPKGQPATIRYISDKAEYTPPVIFSKDSREKLVYRVEAHVTPQIAQVLHVGQPIDVHLQ